MNGMLRDLLSERAEAAGSPDLDLHDLITQGQRRVRRRRLVALGSSVAAVALTVGTAFALHQVGDRTTSPVGPPANPPSTRDVLPGTTDVRPLTYGVGRNIHYGDRIIEAAEDADGLFPIDDGLAILTDNGRASETRLYITDGGEPVQIAHGIERVTAGDLGSLLLWLDGDDVVIYDTRVRSVLDRLPLNGRLLTNPITVLKDAAYWHEYVEDTATTEGRDRLVRYDVSTGTRTRTSEADYRAETQTTPSLVVGSADSTDPVESLSVVGSQLGLATGTERTGLPFVAATGERLRVSVPDGYDDRALYLFQWLDDDRFALVAESGVKRAPIGDLLMCRISAGQCSTIASGDEYWLLPGSSGGVGSED